MYRNMLFVIAILSAAAYILISLLPGGSCMAQEFDVPTVRPIRWDFNDAAEVANVYNFWEYSVSDGFFQGQTKWDPYIFLSMPAGGVDSNKYSFLVVRLFSSVSADNVAVYYKSPNGDWSIGDSFPVEPGWAVYSIDLNKVAWRPGESSSPEAARWGGRTSKVSMLRIDPGNEADRKVMIDWVGLGSAEGKREGVGAVVMSADNNLITCGGFEGVSMEPGAAAIGPWEVIHRKNVRLSTDDLAVEGERSLRIDALGDGSEVALRGEEFEFASLGLYQLSFSAMCNGAWSDDDRIEVRLLFEDILRQPISDEIILEWAAEEPGKWLKAERSFTLPPKAAYGHIEIRFHGEKSSMAVHLDDVRLKYLMEDPSEFEVEWLEPGSLRALPMDGDRNPVAKVEMIHGIPTITINGKPYTGMHYMTGDDLSTINKKLIGNCRDNGIHLYWVNLRRFGWKDDGDYDFTLVDVTCMKLLKYDPDAYIVLDIPLDSYNNPEMVPWNAKHPDDLVRDETGNTKIGVYGTGSGLCPSLASPAWKETAALALRALIRHVRGRSYGERVIGYVPISGVTWEWMYWGEQHRAFVDYSRPFQEAFREWVRKKYNGDINLINRLWYKDFSSVEDIVIPSKKERLGRDWGVFLDPMKNRYIIDFREFFSNVVVDAILHLAKVVKEETSGGSLCGTYYGYVMYTLGPYRAQHNGHFALKRILDSPDIDFLMSPSRYDDRGIGGGSGFMTVVDSLALHKKLYIDQSDIRTLHSDQRSFGRLYTLSDTAAVMAREFASTATAGCATQWYDFGRGWTAGDPRLMQLVGRLLAAEREVMDTARNTRDGNTSIAVIVDEKSTYYTFLESAIHHHLVNAQYPALSRTGAGFDCYLLDDIEHIPDYRVYLFLNTLRITDAQKEFIDRKLKRDGKVLVWVYAPGITDGERLLPERISSITGISIGVDERSSVSRLRITDYTDPITAGLTRGVVYGAETGPVFYADDGEGKVLGVLEGLGKPGLVVKRFTDWTSIYSAAPVLPADLIRGIAEFAGVTITNPSPNDVTYVASNLFAVHSREGGKRVFRVGSRVTKAKELITGEELEVRDGSFAYELKPRSTCIFLLYP